ncbi:PilW family protein [Patescibacteria group bacterium]
MKIYKNQRFIQSKPTKQKLNGFTLTEILVVITVLALVVGVVYSVYALSQRAYRESEMATEIIQNGRVVLERIAREIRQAKEIVTELPEERVNPSEEIIFQNGNISSIIEEGSAQGGSENTITLVFTASSNEDFYEDMFIKIIGGTGVGQIRKIINYNEGTKIAEIEPDWETTPASGSLYRIDTSYHYTRYFKNITDIRRQTIVYYFSGDPNTYYPWDAVPPVGQTLESKILQDQFIGEYVTSLEFWGLGVINISLVLEKNNKKIDLETKIFSRNI